MIQLRLQGYGQVTMTQPELQGHGQGYNDTVRVTRYDL